MGAQGCIKVRKSCDGGVDGLNIRLARSDGHLWVGRSRAGGEVYVAATRAVSTF